MRRIQFFGAPSAGKTVLSLEVVAECKKHGIKCEIITELAREWAYVDRSISSMDQIYLFASQMNREDTLLSRDKVDFVVTDSPLILNCWFSNAHNPVFWKSLEPLVRMFDERFPVLNFFCPLNKSYKFHAEGRHFPAEKSQEISDSLWEFVKEFYGEENVVVLPDAGRLDAVVAELSRHM
jgi:tRNA uridine 5-carbamoylmethylation protein Kti12